MVKYWNGEIMGKRKKEVIGQRNNDDPAKGRHSDGNSVRVGTVRPSRFRPESREFVIMLKNWIPAGVYPDDPLRQAPARREIGAGMTE